MARASSKLNLITDSTMVKVAKRLYTAIRKYAPYKRIKDAVYISRVEGRGDSRFISVGINMDEKTGAPFARAFDTGSGLHGKKKRAKYVISPRNFPYLQFMGTNEFAGRVIRVKKVLHPGVRGVGYTKKAIDEVRPAIRKELSKDVVDNLRLYLRAEFNKFGKK